VLTEHVSALDTAARFSAFVKLKLPICASRVTLRGLLGQISSTLSLSLFCIVRPNSIPHRNTTLTCIHPVFAGDLLQSNNKQPSKLLLFTMARCAAA
jgi:hypothetical protein